MARTVASFRERVAGSFNTGVIKEAVAGGGVTGPI